MRWIKHLTMAHADSALTALSEEFGAEAYGVYWFLVEHIAAPLEAGKFEPSAIHSEVKWAQLAHVSVRRFRAIVTKMSEEGLIVVRPANSPGLDVDRQSNEDRSEKKTPIITQSTSNRLQIEIPKILKYKDEYSKKSRQAPAQEREQRESRERERAEREKTAAPPPDPTPIRPEIPTETERRVRRIAEQAPDPQDFELGVQNALREVASSINPESTLAAMEENLPLWWAAMREGRTKCKTLRWIIPDRDYLRKPREPTARKPPPQSREETLRKALMED